MKNLLYSLFCLSTIFFSCKKDKEKEETKTYCVGYAFKENTPGYSRAIYWENGKQIQLSNENSVSNFIAIYNNDVYISGEEKGQPVYWKNGIKNILPNEGFGSAGKISFYNGNQYITGVNYLKQVVWKNGAIYKTLPSPTISDSISYYGLKMYQDDIYYSKIEIKGAKITSTYFKNETQFSISDASDNYVPLVAVVNTDIYLAGNNRDNTEIYLWKNNVKSVMAKPSNSSNRLYLTNIETDANDVYVFYNERDLSSNKITYKYWKNGVEYLIPVANDFYPYVIKLVNSKICQGGWFNSSGVYGAACFIDNDKIMLNNEKFYLVTDLTVVKGKLRINTAIIRVPAD